MTSLLKKAAHCFAISLVIILNSLSVIGQVSISGPTCVIPGVIYQYTISGSWDPNSTMQLCVSGGIIADSTDTTTCTPAGGAPLSAVTVIWSGNSNGLLTLTSSIGNTSLNINLTQALAPGVLDSTGYQAIAYDTIPETINCSPDSGGFCSPSYADQWQQSLDQVTWTDIAGATSQNLNFTSPLPQTTFFRRKVVESGSGSIAYSNPAAVFVYPLSMVTDSTDSSTGFNYKTFFYEKTLGFRDRDQLAFSQHWLKTFSGRRYEDKFVNVYIKTSGILRRSDTHPAN